MNRGLTSSIERGLEKSKGPNKAVLVSFYSDFILNAKFDLFLKYNLAAV
jgi:hypothetical protein